MPHFLQSVNLTAEASGCLPYRQVERAKSLTSVSLSEPNQPSAPRSGDAQQALAQHLAGQLREHRARRGLTQDQVAKALGCHESAVSRWENGSRFPTGADLVALADLFEVSVDVLLGRARQFAAAGAALVDVRLLEQLAAAESVEAFDQLIEQNQHQTVWLPVPDGAVMVPVADAMRLAQQVADKFPGSRFVDRLFRPSR